FVPDGCQHRRRVRLSDSDGDSLKVTQASRTVVDADCDRVRARPLRLCGRPGETAGGGMDAGSTRRAGVEAKGQALGRKSRTAGSRRKGQQTAFSDQLVPDGRQDRRRVRSEQGCSWRYRGPVEVRDDDKVAAGLNQLKVRKGERGIRSIRNRKSIEVPLIMWWQ